MESQNKRSRFVVLSTLKTPPPSPCNLQLASQLKYYIRKDTTVQEFGINKEDIEETKSSFLKSRHDRINISEVVEHKRRWFFMKPLATIAISSVMTMEATNEAPKIKIKTATLAPPI